MKQAHDRSNPIIFRAIGALVGGAVGDALGAPFEFKSAVQYRMRFPDKIIGGIGEMVGGGSFDWEPGEFTDDTQMALALAESLIVSHGFNPDNVWQRFVKRAETASDIGNITRSALSHETRIGAALSAHQSVGRSAGNGALMRAFPMALAYLDEDNKTTMDAACAQGALTHYDPAAQWGAAIAVELIRRAVLGAYTTDEIDREIDDVLSFVPDNISAGISTGHSLEIPADMFHRVILWTLLKMFQQIFLQLFPLAFLTIFVLSFLQYSHQIGIPESGDQAMDQFGHAWLKLFGQFAQPNHSRMRWLLP